MYYPFSHEVVGVATVFVTSSRTRCVYRVEKAAVREGVLIRTIRSGGGLTLHAKIMPIYFISIGR